MRSADIEHRKEFGRAHRTQRPELNGAWGRGRHRSHGRVEEEHVAGLADELHRLDCALDVLHHGLVALRRVEAATLLRLEAVV